MMPNNLSVENWISAINIILGNFVDCHDYSVANSICYNSPENAIIKKDIFNKASSETKYLLETIIVNPYIMFGTKIKRRNTTELKINNRNVVKFMKSKMCLNNKSTKNKMRELYTILTEMSKL